MFLLSTPSEICQALAVRLRLARLQRNLSQDDVARMVGASLSTVRRLESQGQGTLELVVRVAQALHVGQGLQELFEPVQPSIAALEKSQSLAQRQRARKVSGVRSGARSYADTVQQRPSE